MCGKVNGVQTSKIIVCDDGRYNVNDIFYKFQSLWFEHVCVCWDFNIRWSNLHLIHKYWEHYSLPQPLKDRNAHWVSRRKRKNTVWRLLHLAVEMYNQHSNIGYFLHILLKYICTHLFAAKVRIRCLLRPSSSPVAILYKMSPTMLVPPLGVRWWPRVLVLLGVLLYRESDPLQNIQWQA